MQEQIGLRRFEGAPEQRVNLPVRQFFSKPTPETTMRPTAALAICLLSLGLAACNSSEANVRVTPAPLPELEGKWMPRDIVATCDEGHVRFAPNAIYVFNGREPRKLADILRINVAGPKLDMLIAHADRGGEQMILAFDVVGTKIGLSDLKTSLGESLTKLPQGVPTTFRDQAASAVKSVASLEKLDRC